MEDRTLLELLKMAVQRGEFKLASGRTSTYYLDARLVTMTPIGAWVAAQEILRVYMDERDKDDYPILVRALGGPATAALPLIGACLFMAATRSLPMIGFYTSARPKDHGTGKQVHGPLVPGVTAVLVDDVATSGGSLLESARAVRAMGCYVNTAFCLVDRLEGAVEALAAEDIILRPLYTIRDLGIIPEEQ